MAMGSVRRLGVCLLLVGSGLFVLSGSPGASAQTRAVASLSGPRVFGWGFYTPVGVSSDGTHVWVAEDSSTGGVDAVVELNAATGALVRIIKGSSYGFSGTDSVSSDGTHVWVTNSSSFSVTELSAATGALVKVIKG